MICEITGIPFEVPPGERALLRALQLAHPLLREPLPLPRICPPEFLRRLCAWGNLLHLFRSTSSHSGKPQLSRYNPALPFRSCAPDEFWSGAVENCAAGAVYDFSRPFFEQFSALIRRAQFPAITNPNCEGSEYVNGANCAKNCYLCFGAFNSEECLYSYMIHNCVGCIDCIDLVQCSYCYDCFVCRKCYECRHAVYCIGSSSCVFCEDCVGCSNCLFCCGLRNASYCVRNVQVSRQQYEQELAKLQLHRRTGLCKAREEFRDFRAATHHTTQTLNNAEGASGHCLTNVQNVLDSYFTHNAKDCGYLFLSHDCSDVWRGVGESSHLTYQSLGHFGTYAAYNCYTDVGGNFNLYSVFMFNGCAHCFGCAGLNKKSYCILNRQYQKSEYEALVPRIIAHMQSSGEWGQFFPPAIAPHFYEHCFANDWLAPLPYDEVRRRGYRTGATDSEECRSDTPASAIPDTLEQTSWNFTDKIYACEQTGRPFRFQKSEVEWYRNHGVPPPAIHWQQRIRSRIAENFLIPCP